MIELKKNQCHSFVLRVSKATITRINIAHFVTHYVFRWHSLYYSRIKWYTINGVKRVWYILVT